MSEVLREQWDTSTNRRFRMYWGSLTDPQRILVLDAYADHWSQGEPLPTDTYMELHDNNINAEYLQEFFMEE